MAEKYPMLQFLKDALSEGSQISTMRIMSFLAFFVGSLIALYGVWTGKNMAELSVLVGVFIGAAFGGKVGQKFAEAKAAKDETSEPPKPAV